MITEINQPRKVKRIPVKILTEIKYITGRYADYCIGDIEWHDNFGINTPYKVEIINQ